MLKGVRLISLQDLTADFGVKANDVFQSAREEQKVVFKAVCAK